MRRGIANSNVHIVASDLDVANHANLEVYFVVGSLCDAIFDVIDHDHHCGCLFQLYLADVDVVGIPFFYIDVPFPLVDVPFHSFDVAFDATTVNN